MPHLVVAWQHQVDRHPAVAPLVCFAGARREWLGARDAASGKIERWMTRCAEHREHIPGARLVEFPGINHMIIFGDLEPLLDQIQEFVTCRAGPGTGEDQLLATLLAATIAHPTDTRPIEGQAAAQNVLEGQRTVVHRELTRFRARQVSTTEDGWLAAFLSPSRAIACADGIRTAIAPLGLDLATGIHTGECDTTTGDLIGLPIDVAVRVAALADPGQVLVTSMVKDLIGGTHLTFSLHGVAQLSGVPGAWTLYAVGNADRRSAGPPAAKLAPGA